MTGNSNAGTIRCFSASGTLGYPRSDELLGISSCIGEYANGSNNGNNNGNDDFDNNYSNSDERTVITASKTSTTTTRFTAEFDTPWKFLGQEDALQLVLICRHGTRTLLRRTSWLVTHASMLDIKLVADPDVTQTGPCAASGEGT
jgi:hypothetical protein